MITVSIWVICSVVNLFMCACHIHQKGTLDLIDALYAALISAFGPIGLIVIGMLWCLEYADIVLWRRKP